MVKILNKIIFHFYQFQIKVGNKDVALLTTTLFFTLMIGIVTITIIFFLVTKDVIHFSLVSNYVIILFTSLLFIPVYYFIKKKTFLDYNFIENRSGYLLLLLFIIIVMTACILVADKNREKRMREKGYSQELINNEGIEPFDPNKNPTSLEGEIRLWYYKKFKKDTIK